jgi:hypothetical protein
METMPDETAAAALASALADVDRHLAAQGWDRPATLYALVDTAALLAAEPGLGGDVAATSALTPVEQEALPEGVGLDEWLPRIGWPPEVLGCAVAQEVVTLPPSVEAEVPDDGAIDWAAAHPLRRELRMVVGVLRDGSRATVLRVRGAEEAGDDVVTGPDLVPRLADALAATLAD